MMLRTIFFCISILLANISLSGQMRCAEIGDLSKYDLIELAKVGTVVICDSETTFSKHELEELLRSRVKISIRTSKTDLSKYDLMDISKAGKLDLIVDSDKFSKYELIDIAKTRAKVVIIKSEFFKKYELIDILKAGGSLGRS